MPSSSRPEAVSARAYTPLASPFCAAASAWASCGQVPLSVEPGLHGRQHDAGGGLAGIARLRWSGSGSRRPG